MPSVIYASSLAGVIDLADNPPSHPQDEALPNSHEPLTLYIARVPGSRDVFLTTMKPQQKVVTAQDVQSSLYYIHVDSVDDYKLLQSEGSDDDDRPEIQGLPNHQTSVRCKPVSQPPQLASRDALGIPAFAQLSLQDRSRAPLSNAKVARKPLGQGIKSGQMSLNATPALPPRKLLGPRAMNQRLQSVDSSVLQDKPERQNIDVRRWSEQPGVIPPRLPPRVDRGCAKETKNDSLSSERETMEYQRTHAENEISVEHCWGWERSWEQKRANEAREEMAKVCSEWRESNDSRRSPENTSLSLIRRYNGAQWNIGRISSTGPEAGIPSAMMSIELLTKGYSKFIDFHGANEPSSLLSTTENVPNTAEKSNNVFWRQFQVPGSHERSHPSHTQSSSRPQSFVEQGSSSAEHGQPRRDSFRASTTDPLGHKSSISKGYMIRSPWNGACEFSTGIAGRSLKCKHSYASTNKSLEFGTFSAPVSELRFNLPSSRVLGIPAAKSHLPGTPRETKRSSRFLGTHHRHSSSSDRTHESHDQEYSGTKVEVEDRLDLSLGQEHAGGGFGGKQAKLGKLIIEAKGLQMLDFVVAANMAIWWRIYERIT